MEEILYPAMEDAKLDILIGKGPTARSIRLDLPRFTLVGRHHPHRPRVGPRCGTGSVSSAGSTSTTRSTCRPSSSGRPASSGCGSSAEGAARIAERSRGTPRVANRLLRRVRDFVEVRGDGVVTGPTAREGLEVFGVDELGLDKVDRAILDALCRRFGGRPVGLTTLAQCVGEETDDHGGRLRAVPPPAGLVIRTPRGRVPTARAWAHLGLSAEDAARGDPLGPPRVAGSLF